MSEPTANLSYYLSEDLIRYRDAFIKQCKPQSFARSTVIGTGGQTGLPVYYILSGMVKIYTINPDGYMRILGYHEHDTIFAMDRICEADPTVVTCESVTPVKALKVTWQDIRHIASEHPDLLPDLIRYYGKVLRLMCYDAEIKSIDSVRVRLASFLCTAAKASANAPYTIRLTQEELASAVNASRVQIARVASDFQREGLIKSGRGTLVILNMPSLRKIMRGPGDQAVR